jgi:hypothetical protein
VLSNVVEEDVQALDVHYQDGDSIVLVDVKPFQVVTLKLK